MKMIVWRGSLALFLITAITMFLYGVRAYRRAEKEAEMDARELQYDADGGFIMIDMQEGLMGVYKAVRPVRHIWKKRLKRLSPGIYNLSICDGWIELYNKDLHGVYVIDMNEDDNRFFLSGVEQDIPVLVY